MNSISRRDFLKLSRDALFGLAGASLLSADAQLPQPEFHWANELIKQSGLQDFSSVYAITKSTEQVYGGHCALFTSVEVFNSVMDKVARGEIDKNHPEVQRIRDGWGEKKDQAMQDALMKIDSITINTTMDDASGEEIHPENVRAMLRRIAQVSPLSILAMGDEVKHGGEMGYDKFIAMPITGDLKDVSAIDIHELNHALDDNWERVKPYISREDYLGYLTLNLQLIKSFADTYCRLPIDKTLNSFGGQLFSWRWDVDAAFKDPAALEQFSQIEPLLPDYAEKHIPIDSDSDTRKRYEIMMHEIGKLLVTLPVEDPFRTALIQNQYVRGHMSRLLTNIGHSFVFPVSEGDRLLSSEDKQQDGWLVWRGHQMAIDTVRKAFFTNIPGDITLEKFRNALDIEEERPRLSYLLTQYGSKDLGIHEYEPHQNVHVFSLPDIPWQPERKLLYIKINDEKKELEHDCIISVTDGSFDTTSDTLKADLVQEKEGIHRFSLTDASGKMISFTSEVLSIGVVLYKSDTAGIEVLATEKTEPDELSFDLDHRAHASIVLRGDITSKVSASGDVIWLAGVGEEIHIYPVEGITPENTPQEFLRLQGMILTKNGDNTNSTLTEGTLVDDFGTSVILNSEIEQIDRQHYRIYGQLFQIPEDRSQDFTTAIKQEGSNILLKPYFQTSQTENSVEIAYMIIFKTNDGTKRTIRIPVNAIL